MGADDPRRLDVLHLRRDRRPRRRRRAGSSPRTRASSRGSSCGSTASGRCCSPPARSSTSRPPSTCATRSPAGSRRTRSRSCASASSARACRTTSSVRNESAEPVAFELELEVGTDFADIISVKEHDFALGDPLRARPLPPPAGVRVDATRNQLVLEENGERRRAHAGDPLPQPARPTARIVRFPIELEPRERWELRVDVVAVAQRQARTRRAAVKRRFGEERAARARLARGLAPAACRSSAPTATSSRTRSTSPSPTSPRCACAAADGRRAAARRGDAVVHDRLRARHADHLPADDAARARARGRLARGARRAAGARGRPVDRRRAGQDRPRAPPRPRGRDVVRHLLRHGRRDAALPRPALRGRGAGRPTPSSSQRLRGPALAALDWIDDYGDRDGDGFVEYERRTARGLENQSWKDSGDSQRFHDGTLAQPPIAPAEVQGYVYDAKLRLAELAREVWRDRRSPSGSRREAEALRTRFDEAFWVEERGGYYALALDGDKRPRRLALLEHRPPALERDRPAGAGGGDRGPAARRRALVGLGRPHDVDRRRRATTRSATTTAPSGRTTPPWARGGSRGPAVRRTSARSRARCSRRRASSTGRCPRCSPASARGETPFPIAYPTAARPQAWAAGTPVLLLRLLLGLEPDPATRELRTYRRGCCPSGSSGLELPGVRAFGRSWDVAVDGRPYR